MICIERSAGFEGRGIRARTGLRERPSAEFLPARQKGQIFLLLRFASKAKDMTCAKRIVRSDDQRQRAIESSNLFDNDRGAKRIESRAAVLLGDVDAEKPQVRHPRNDVARKPRRLVPS